MRSGILLAITVVTYLVLRNEFGVDDIGTMLVIIFPLTLITGAAWWADQSQAQRARNEEFRKRQAELSARFASESSPGASDVARTDPVAIDGATPAPPSTTVAGLPIVLYLRQFEQDGALSFRNPRKDTWQCFVIPLYSIMLPDYVTFDEALRWHFAERFEVVALGEQQGAVGATRWTTSDDTWRRDFAVFCARARLIVIFPTTSPGTAWEIAEICAKPELLAKTAFVVVDPDKVGVDDAGRPVSFAALLGAQGCAVPEKLENGEALMFDAGKRLRHREPLLTAGFLEVIVQPRALAGLADRCGAPART